MVELSCILLLKPIRIVRLLCRPCNAGFADIAQLVEQRIRNA